MSAERPQPTMEALRALLPVRGAKRRGLYAAAPGTGPAGRTCHSCAHLRYSHHTQAKHPKCGLTAYTHGDATTIRTSMPACHRYEESAG